MQASAGSRRFSRILGWLFADGVDFGEGTFISRFGCGLMGLMMAAVVAMAAAPELTRFLPVVIAGGFLLCIDVLWTSAEGWLAIGDLLDRARQARQSQEATLRPGRWNPVELGNHLLAGDYRPGTGVPGWPAPLCRSRSCPAGWASLSGWVSCGAN